MRKIFTILLLALTLSSYIPTNLIVYAAVLNQPTAEEKAAEEKAKEETQKNADSETEEKTSTEEKAKTTTDKSKANENKGSPKAEGQIGTWTSPTDSNAPVTGKVQCSSLDASHSSAASYNLNTNGVPQKITYGFKTMENSFPWYQTNDNVLAVDNLEQFPNVQVYTAGDRIENTDTADCIEEEWSVSSFNTQKITRRYIVNGPSNNGPKDYPYEVSVYPDTNGTMYYEQIVTNPSGEQVPVSGAVKLLMNTHEESNNDQTKVIQDDEKLRALNDQTSQQTGVLKGVYQQQEINNKFYTSSIILDDTSEPFKSEFSANSGTMTDPNRIGPNEYLVSGEGYIYCGHLGGSLDQTLNKPWKCEDTMAGEFNQPGNEDDTLQKNQIIEPVYGPLNYNNPEGIKEDNLSSKNPGLTMRWEPRNVAGGQNERMVFAVNPNDNRVPPQAERLEIESKARYDYTNENKPADAAALMNDLKSNYGVDNAKLFYYDDKGEKHDVTATGEMTASNYNPNTVGEQTVTLTGKSNGLETTKEVIVNIAAPVQVNYTLDSYSHIVYPTQSAQNTINKEALLADINAQFKKDGNDFNGTNYSNIAVQGFDTINQTQTGAYNVELKGMDGEEKANKKVLVIFKDANAGIDITTPNVPGGGDESNGGPKPTKLIDAIDRTEIGKKELGTGIAAASIVSTSQVKLWDLNSAEATIQVQNGSESNFDQSSLGIKDGSGLAGQTYAQTFKYDNASTATNWAVMASAAEAGSVIADEQLVFRPTTSQSLRTEQAMIDALNGKINVDGTDVPNSNNMIEMTGNDNINFDETGAYRVKLESKQAIDGLPANQITPDYATIIVMDASSGIDITLPNAPDQVNPGTNASVLIDGKSFDISEDRLTTDEATIKSQEFANARAWDITNIGNTTNGSITANLAVDLTNDSAENNKLIGGGYVVNTPVPQNLEAKSSSANKTANLTVNGTPVAGAKKVITTDGYAKYDVGATKDEKAVLQDLAAKLFLNSVEISNAIADGKLTITNFDEIDFSQPSATVVEIASTKGDADPVKALVVVKDGSVDFGPLTPEVPGQEQRPVSMITAHGFSISETAVKAGDVDNEGEIAAKTEPKFWDLSSATDLGSIGSTTPVLENSQTTNNKLIAKTAVNGEKIDQNYVGRTADSVEVKKTVVADVTAATEASITTDKFHVYDVQNSANAISEDALLKDVNTQFMQGSQNINGGDTYENVSTQGFAGVDQTKTSAAYVTVKGDNKNGLTAETKVLVIFKDANTGIDVPDITKPNTDLPVGPEYPNGTPTTMIDTTDYNENITVLPYASSTPIIDNSDATVWTFNGNAVTTSNEVTINANTKLLTGDYAYFAANPVVPFTAEKIVGSKTITSTSNATIANNANAELTADKFIIYDVQSNDNAISESDFFRPEENNGVNPIFTVGGANANGNNNENLSTNGGFDGIDQTKVGASRVTITGTKDGKNATQSVLVIFKDANTNIDVPDLSKPNQELPAGPSYPNGTPNSMVYAIDFEDSINNVPYASADTVAENGDAIVWDLTTLETRLADIKADTKLLTGDDAYFVANPVVPYVAYSNDGAKEIAVTKNATITVDESDMSLTAKEIVEYPVGTAPTTDGVFLNKDNANAVLTPAGELSSNYETVVGPNRDKVGAYDVLVTGTVGEETLTRHVTVAITDGDVNVDKDKKLMISAKGFSKSRALLPLSDKGLADTQAKAWDLTPGDVSQLPQSGLSIADNALDNNPVTLEAGDVEPVTVTATKDDRSTSRTVDATITEDTRSLELATEKIYAEYNKNEVVTSENLFNKVTPNLDLIDGENSETIGNENITANGINSISTAEAGAYVVELTGNYDGLTSNTVKVVVAIKDDSTNLTPVTPIAPGEPNTPENSPRIMIDAQPFEVAKAKTVSGFTSDEAKSNNYAKVKTWNLSDTTNGVGAISPDSTIVTATETEGNELFNTENDLVENDVVPTTFNGTKTIDGNNLMVETTVDGTVTDGRTLALTGDQLHTYEKGSNVAKDEFLNAVDGQLTVTNTDSTTEDVTANGEINITNEEFNKIDFDTVGAYVVEVTGEYQKLNAQPLKVVVAVWDENTGGIDITDPEVDPDGMVYAEDFEQDIKDLPATTQAVNQVAKSKAWDFRTPGQAIPVDPATIVTDDNVIFHPTQTEEAGQVVPTTFQAKVGADVLAETVADGTLKDSRAADLTVKDLVIMSKDDLMTEAEFLSPTGANPVLKPDTAKIEALDYSNVKNEVGAYLVEVKGTTKGGQTDTEKVVVAVIDEFTILDPANKLMIRANDFTKEVSDLPLVDAGKADSNAKAWDLAVASVVTIDPTITDNDLNNDPVTLNGASPNVPVTVNAQVGTRKAYKTVEADIVDTRDAKLTAKDWITYTTAEVAAANETFINDVNSDVTFDDQTVDSGANITSNFKDVVRPVVGPYTVTVNAVTSGGVQTNSETVNVNVVDNTVTEDDEYLIAANDFTTHRRYIPGEQLDGINRAQVKAWNKVTGVKAKPVVINSDLDSIGEVNDSLGDHPVKYGAIEDTFFARFLSEEIVAEADRKITVIDDRVPHIEALPLVRYNKDKNEVPTADQTFLTDAQAKLIFDDNTAAKGTLNSDFLSSVRNEVGMYVVTVNGQADNGIDADPITVMVEVYDKHVVETDEEMLTAHSFKVDSKDVDALTSTSVNKLADAKAWNKLDASSVDFTTDYSAIEKEAGPYPVTFKTAKGLTTTVTANVIDENTGENNKEAIHAENFKLHVKEVKDLATTVNSRANAYAWNMETGADVELTSDITSVIEKAGTYPVTFKTAEGMTRTVKATVVDDDTEIDPITGIHVVTLQ
ncbi:MAG: hypothetical protein ACRCUP_01100 [Mycoplasmatales bacterium]